MSDNGKNGRRGRPIGFKLSESSKRAISQSKRGQRHRQETKDKISHSLIVYFKNKNPLSEELTNMYCNLDEGGVVCDWMEENTDNIDSIEDVMTLKSLRNANRIEITVGPNIEYFSHDITPEMLTIFIIECEQMGVDPCEYFDELGYI
jgi:hypothetical protein